MALGITAVRRQHAEPTCRHFEIDLVDDDTLETRTILVHERHFTKDILDVFEDAVILGMIRYFIANKQGRIEQLVGRNLINDTAGSRGAVRTLIRDVVT